MSTTNTPSPRIIPAIEQLRRLPAAAVLEARFGQAALVDALRLEAAALRERFRTADDDANALPATEQDVAAVLVAAAGRRLTEIFAPSLQRVINATGVILHTNLGRAPLPPLALQRIAELGPGYSNLEYDLSAGGRGRRDVHAERLLVRLTGAERAVVVNNNAAATMLMLAALARGREVIISRGELVEIGGGFRVPDVMAQSGAILREVGTTNRTRVADYAAAITERTGMILRVHPSNFRIEGFTERPELAELASLAHRHGVVLAEDLGSGLPDGAIDPHHVLGDEPTIPASLKAGVDVLCFSGDKLLGGPQAGILVGRNDLISTIRVHPLMRALRVDKLTYAALEGTLLAWLSGRPEHEVPVVRMLALSPAAIAERAQRVAHAIRGASGVRASLVEGSSTTGGGSAPGSQLPTMLLAVECNGMSAGEIEAALRAANPPIIARVENDRVVLDLRTVPEQDDETLAAALGGLAR